jgi:hypothetical protein
VIKALFLAPVRDNEGRRFPPSLWTALNRRLVATFGGYSVVSGVQGAWQFEGQLYHDRSRQYTVAFASWGQLSTWLEIVTWVRENFRQEAIYIEVDGRPEIWQG